MTFSASSDLVNIGRDDAPAWIRNSSMEIYCRTWIACMPNHSFLWSDDVFDVVYVIPWRKGGSAHCQMAACGLSFAVNSIGSHHNYRHKFEFFARRSICPGAFLWEQEGFSDPNWGYISGIQDTIWWHPQLASYPCTTQISIGTFPISWTKVPLTSDDPRG
jgi:hypothetical protein